MAMFPPPQFSAINDVAGAILNYPTFPCTQHCPSFHLTAPRTRAELTSIFATFPASIFDALMTGRWLTEFPSHHEQYSYIPHLLSKCTLSSAWSTFTPWKLHRSTMSNFSYPSSSVQTPIRFHIASFQLFKRPRIHTFLSLSFNNAYSACAPSVACNFPSQLWSSDPVLPAHPPHWSKLTLTTATPNHLYRPIFYYFNHKYAHQLGNFYP